MTKNTYLLRVGEDERSELLELLSGLEFVREKGGRAVCVLGEGQGVKRGWVVRKLSGNQFDLVRNWVENGVLDDLHDEFLQGGVPAPRVQARAIEAWKRARKGVSEAEAGVLRARQREAEASARLVRTHGKVSLVIDGELYRPSSMGERVYFCKATRKKAENGEG